MSQILTIFITPTYSQNSKLLPHNKAGFWMGSEQAAATTSQIQNSAIYASGDPILACMYALNASVLRRTNKYTWDDTNIECPKSFITIGSIEMSLFGGLSFISLFSLSLLSIPIIILIIKKKIKIHSKVFSYRHEDKK
jgi:hypothetical protein